MPRFGNPKHPRRHFIRELRQYRGLTQVQLAERMKTTRANISRIESFKEAVTQDSLEAYAVALQTDPTSLLIRNPIDPEGKWSIWDQADIRSN